MTTYFTTDSGAHYLYSLMMKDLFLLHPVMNILLNKNSEIDRTSLEKIEKVGIEIDGVYYGPKEISYYLKKISFYKGNSVFEDCNSNISLDGRYIEKQIDSAIANINHIVFEVTEKCNLNCEYCAYGKYYNNHDARSNRNLSVNAGKKIIDFFFYRTGSIFNTSFNDNLVISFYGGEPLMNFTFINNIVKYSREQKLHNKNLKFKITTNGLLLHKYYEYLIENDFEITISLDGNKEHNKYRIFKDGSESFDKVLRNVKVIKKNHHEYFVKNIRFQAVLNSYSQLTEMYDFFESEFQKKIKL